MWCSYFKRIANTTLYHYAWKERGGTATLEHKAFDGGKKEFKKVQVYSGYSSVDSPLHDSIILL